MCSCEFVESNYGSVICSLCGVELKRGLPPYDRYTSNSPLTIGYSRELRVKNMLNQLFQPTLYCYPSSEVLYLIYIRQSGFMNGCELLAWLGKLVVKNKKYNASHYYFLFANRDVVAPPCPPETIYRKILSDFHQLENLFHIQGRQKTSFFSYNWLIRKLLQKNQLHYYVQFIKAIKCKHRSGQYQKMYNELIKTLSIPPTVPAHVLNSHKSLSVSPGRALLSLHRGSLYFSDPVVRNLLSTQGPLS